jgi:AcrR family transcriptional regulator/DNA-binding MarR family transcriptional regulator
MEEAQRTRILEVVAELVAERGVGLEAVTMAKVAERADVSRATLEQEFEDREACLLAAFELGVQRAGAEMTIAYYGEPHWIDAVKAALAHFVYFLEAEPALGRLLVVYSTGGGVRVLRRRMEILATLAAIVDRGRAEGPGGKDGPPEVVAEGVVGAVLAVLANRLLSAEEPALMDLFGSLVSIIVLPYLGAGTARREMVRPAPRVRSRDELEADLSQLVAGGESGVRLTYRTARVLSAIERYPGASNREVGERAGIIDQGQVSKLLARLEARQLIEKAGEARTRGAPNAWRLTRRGEALMGTAGLRAAVRTSKLPRI